MLLSAPLLFFCRDPAPRFFFFFFFNDTATTEIYTLSLHDALPISLLLVQRARVEKHEVNIGGDVQLAAAELAQDRKSTRLNSSHLVISYAVFCLKKKKKGSDGLSVTPCNDLSLTL